MQGTRSRDRSRQPAVITPATGWEIKCGFEQATSLMERKMKDLNLRIPFETTALAMLRFKPLSQSSDSSYL